MLQETSLLGLAAKGKTLAVTLAMGLSIAVGQGAMDAKAQSGDTFLSLEIPEEGPIKYSDPAFVDHGPNDERVSSFEKGNLAFVPIGIPKQFPDGDSKKHEAVVQILEAISEGREPTNLPYTIESIEVLIVVEGTKYGSGCHWYGGNYHCH